MEIPESGVKVNIRDDEERVCVSVRIKPFDIDPISDWECINDDTIVYKNVGFLASERLMYPTAYTFDRVFDSDCSTREVYEHGAKDVALSVVRGINSTVFAYGQTSSGKTYTMTGITEYAIADIYDYIHKNTRRDFILKFSAMEIYDESVRDLLSSDSTPLRLIYDPERGTIVEKLTEEVLRDKNHATELFSICKAQTLVAETTLNEMSLRSHQIIRLTIESSSSEFLGRNNASTLSASVNFVDLAGNEQASQSLPASAINHCLLTLEAVIRKLSKDSNGHIPYEDSNLTRILQMSLGGNARTAIICTMGLDRSQVEQSRNTLLFASCAKEVTTKARVNLVMSDKALVMHLRKELASLESELRNSRPGIGPYNYRALLREKDVQIEKLEKEIKNLILQRDIALSQVKEFKEILGDDAISRTRVASGHYPHFRVQNSPDSEIGKIETYPLDDDPFLDVESTPFSVRIPFCEDSFEHGYMSPRVLLSSSNSSVSDSYHAWLEIEKQSDRVSGDLLRDRQEIESVDLTDDHEEKEELTARVVPPNEIFKKDNDFSTIQYLDIAHHLDKDSLGAKRLNLTRSSSCRASITSDSFSPWVKASDYGANTPAVESEKESDGCEGKMSGIDFDDSVGIYPENDCRDSQGNGSGIKMSRSFAEFSTGACGGGVSSSSDKVEETELQNEQGTTIRQEETEQKVNEPPEKNVKDVGLDLTEDECKGLTSWPVSFRRLQKEIIEHWHACNVSLAHRTYFFLLFQGDPSDAIYLEIEIRRMKYLKDKFTRGDKTVVDGRPLTLSSSAKALRRERRTLSEQMAKKFSELDREKLFMEWGIGLNTKLRRLQLAHRVWSKTAEDINHVTESAFLVAKLVGLIEPGVAPNRERCLVQTFRSSPRLGSVVSSAALPLSFSLFSENQQELFGMDPEEFRAILSRSRVGIWELIQAAIKVAGLDYGEELPHRRDKIVESLYTPTSQICWSCNGSLVVDGLDEPYYPQAITDTIIDADNNNDNNGNRLDKDNSDKRNSNDDFSKSPLTPESDHRNISGGEDEDGADPYEELFDDDEHAKIINIKEQLEIPHQSEDDVIQLLQNLEDMDITFQVLKETDIGRHVNRLKKHPSNEVRGLVKQLVRKWKETVDEWVRVNQQKATSNLIADGDSPQQSIPKIQQNGHLQDRGTTVERSFGEHEAEAKTLKFAPRTEVPSRPQQSLSKSAAAPPNREPVVDDDRLNSARKRLQENYQEAQNAKRQRTIQVMDIHEIPKPKSKDTFFAKNKGGFQGRHHR